MSIDIGKLIAKGECINIEFKECVSELSNSVYETVCSFSNRMGGHLFLGVTDDGEIIGVDPKAIKKLKHDFATAINNPNKISPTIYASVTEHYIDGKPILYVLIPYTSQVHRLSGRIFDRNEDGDIDITDSTILVQDLYNRKGNNYTEIRVFPHITIADLDSRRIEDTRERAVKHKKDETHLWGNLSNLDLLKSANLYGKDAQTDREGLNLAGILLLGSEQLIISVLPHHKTDAILRVRDLNRYDDRDVICVNLVESYFRLMAFVKKHLDDPFFIEGTERVHIRNVVFREVCSNLLIHREFSNAFPAKLIIEQGQVRTENSNRPHGFGEVDPTDFSPFPKNPIISKFFREIGLADELGSGFKNLNHYVPLYSGQKPSFYEGNVFKTNVPIPDWKGRAVITPQDNLQDAPQDTPQDITEILLEFCGVPRTRVEILGKLGLKDKNHLTKVYLTPLMEKGLIVMTIPDKPTSRNQKYVIKTQEQALRIDDE